MGRLMKYELRSTMKLFTPLWLAVLALAVINRFTLFNPKRYFSQPVNILADIVILLYVFAIIGVFVVALIFVIQRFYQGLLKDEGYLTFTLPVRIDSILWGKTFSSLILLAGSMLVCLLSLLLMFMNGDVWANLSDSWRQLVQVSEGRTVVLTVILLLIVLLASIIPAVLYLYLSMSIGHLSQKHRVGASVLAYVGIRIVLSLVSNLVMSPVRELAWDGNVWNLSSVQTVWLLFAIAMAVVVVESAIFYFPARYILRRHLNLE